MTAHQYIDFHGIARRAMVHYGFFYRFPARAKKEIKQFAQGTVLPQNDPAIQDLRSLLWSSIDNSDSLDLDQLEYCERRSNQEIRVLVAIADVSEYIPKGSQIDRYALHNATSLYTGLEIFPMLPLPFSTDLTSLKQDEDRLAVVIEYFVRKDGSFRPGDVFQAFVRNKAKLVYESIGEWLEGKGPIPELVKAAQGLEDQVRLQNEAAQRLHGFRRERGALELETIEPKVVIHNGRIVDLVVRHKNLAHAVIENFMIAANGTMMNFLELKNSPTIQRVLREPEHWERIREVAGDLGDELPYTPDSKALSDFLVRQRKKRPDQFPDLSLTIVKLIGAAEYMLFEPGKKKYGHFGLAVHDYVHSTAPNRRYVDLVIQRILKGVVRESQAPYTKKEIHQIAEWCTERVLAAKRVERFMRKVAATILLADRIGEVFEGIVTGASEKGTYVRLEPPAPPVEGRVVRNEYGLIIGQKVKVRLMRMLPEKGYIDFERLGRNGVNGIKREVHIPQKDKTREHRRRQKRKYFS